VRGDITVVSATTIVVSATTTVVSVAPSMNNRYSHKMLYVFFTLLSLLMFLQAATLLERGQFKHE